MMVANGDIIVNYMYIIYIYISCSVNGFSYLQMDFARNDFQIVNAPANTHSTQQASSKEWVVQSPNWPWEIEMQLRRAMVFQ